RRRGLPSVSELAEVLAGAAADGARVSIGREGGDIVLSTDGLDRVLEHEAGDLTCVVEAGVRVRDLNERLAEHGQMLALDPPGNPTIGACIAADLSGPRRHRYGTVRDLLLGVTVVLGDGLVANAVALLWPDGLALLFEGSRRAVDAQVADACRLLGGREDDGSIWAEVARRQQEGTRHRFESLDGLGNAIVRMGPRIAYSTR